MLNPCLSAALIEITTAGDNVVIPARMGKRISVYRVLLVSDKEVYLTVKSGSTPRTGPMLLAKAGQLVLPLSTAAWVPRDYSGWLNSSPGEALVLHLSGACKLSGQLCYCYL